MWPPKSGSGRVQSWLERDDVGGKVLPTSSHAVECLRDACQCGWDQGLLDDLLNQIKRKRFWQEVINARGARLSRQFGRGLGADQYDTGAG